MYTFENLWNKGFFGILGENAGHGYIFLIGIVLSAVTAYLLGSVNFGVLISKLAYRDDVRTHGSGNGGMTNMLRTYGRGAAAVTFLGDAFKAALSILVVGRMLAGQWGADVAGLACVLGHVFPVYFHFKGGKGVVTIAVMILCQNPFVFLTLFVIFIIIVLMTKYVSLGSCMCMIVYPYVLYRVSGSYGSHIIIAMAAALFVLWTHRENIKRLRAGKENKISLSKKKKSGGMKKKSGTDCEPDKEDNRG